MIQSQDCSWLGRATTILRFDKCGTFSSKIETHMAVILRPQYLTIQGSDGCSSPSGCLHVLNTQQLVANNQKEMKRKTTSSWWTLHILYSAKLFVRTELLNIAYIKGEGKYGPCFEEKVIKNLRTCF